MKTGTLATKLMLAAILLTVLVYFGLNMAAYFMDPFTTAMTYTYTSERAVTVSGYTVREEEVLPSGGELVYFSRAEGEKCSAGGTVALVYPNAEALQSANELRTLEQQLEQLLYARSLVAGTQTSMRLDEEIAASLVSLRRSLDADNLSAALDNGTALRAGLLKRSYTYTGTADLESTIAALQEQISALAAASDPGISRITAPRSGLFSSLADGYETVLLPENIKNLTPNDLRTLTAQPTGGAVGKMIYGTRWSYVALMRTVDVGKLQVGDTVRLRFQKGLDRDLTMQVEYISDEMGGQQVVSFTSDRYLNLTTLLRHQNAQIIFDSATGIRVPRSAVRVLWEPVVDEEGNPVLLEDGTQAQKQSHVVYCLWGNYAKRKPVEILWSAEEDYLLVAPVEGTSNERRLRPGDEVITAADDLYDGKVVVK